MSPDGRTKGGEMVRAARGCGLLVILAAACGNNPTNETAHPPHTNHDFDYASWLAPGATCSLHSQCAPTDVCETIAGTCTTLCAEP